MIRNLKPETVQPFGRMPKDHPLRKVNAHSIVLSPEEIWEYQAFGETWIRAERGRTVLSLSEDGKQYEDFYLEKPVLLKDGTFFSLTAFQEESSIQMAGLSFPRLIRTGRKTDRFEVRPELRILRLINLFYREAETDFRDSGGSHTMMELTYVDRGVLHSVTEAGDMALQPGEITLYLPHQWHRQYADGGNAPGFVTITFDAAGLKQEMFADRRFPASQDSGALIHKMLKEQENQQTGCKDMILCLLTQLLLTLLRLQSGTPERRQLPHSVAGENEIIQRAADYVETHIREKLTVPAAASGIGVSASYLTALFQKHMKISPGEYIRTRKLQEGKQLIRQGKMNFTEIAETLHYSTIHQFSRQFKEKFGITPSEYAKSVRE